MTDKDYVAIAAVLKEYSPGCLPPAGVSNPLDPVVLVAYRLADMFQEDNPSFDRYKFLIAAGATVFRAVARIRLIEAYRRK